MIPAVRERRKSAQSQLVFRAKRMMLSASTWALSRARHWPHSSHCPAHGRGSMHGALLDGPMIRSLFGEVWKGDLSHEVRLLWGNSIPSLGTPLFWNSEFRTELAETGPTAHRAAATSLSLQRKTPRSRSAVSQLQSLSCSPPSQGFCKCLYFQPSKSLSFSPPIYYREQ